MSSSEYPKSTFRSSSGQRYLRALFYEMVMADKSTVSYTLKDRDHQSYPSLYRLYMEAADPTEYRFATAHLDGWVHWEELTQCDWFKPYVERWRRELDVKLRSEALAKIMAEAAAGSQNSYHANKYLLEGPWKPTEKKKTGPTTRVAIQQEAHRIVSEGQEMASDHDRLFRKAN
jgi:hypothetical protein